MQNYSHPFIKHVRHQCKRYNCKFKLVYKARLDDLGENETCDGYFTEDPLELVVATRTYYTDFLSILVHEYSHFEQWIEGSDYSTSSYKVNHWDILNRWLQGENFTKRTVRRAIDVIRNYELDCERRSVENIKKYNLPINIPNYCKKASAYIYFHNFMKKRRLWEVEKGPCSFKSIIKEMPDTLTGNYSKTPRHIMKLYTKHLKP